MTDAIHEITHPAARDATQQALPGADAMGTGYDINGRYADPASLIGTPLFDFGDDTTSVTIGERTYVHPRAMKVTTGFASELWQEHDEDIESYRRQLGMDVGVSGGYQLFKASLQVDFAQSDLRLTHMTYSATRETHRLWYITLPPARELRARLRPDVQADIDNPGLSPQDLFARYGAYYVAEIAVGGRLDFTCATRHLNVESSQSLAVAAAASYQGLTGQLSVTAGSSLARDVASFQAHSTMRLNATGGRPGLASRILHGPDSAQAFGEWADSLLDYAAMMDFTSEGLRPIWDLAASEDRRAQLRDAFPGFVVTREPPVDKIDAVLELSLRPMVLDGTDKGSGARRDLAVFRPQAEDGFFWVGHYGQSGKAGPAGGFSPMLRDNFRLGLLQAPTGWERLWKHGDDERAYECWLPTAPQHYRALGVVMVLGKAGGPPSVDDFACVHESVCHELARESIGASIWDDGGAPVRADLSLHPLAQPAPRGQVGLGPVRTLVPLNRHDEQVNDQDVLALRRMFLGMLSGTAVTSEAGLAASLARWPELRARLAR